MSDDLKSTEKPFEFPMMPIFGVDLGERLGELAAGQKQTKSDIQELKAEIKALDAKFEAKIEALDAKLEAKTDKLEAKIEALDAKLDDKTDKLEAKTDKMAYAINRLDERTKHLSMVTWGGIIVLLIAIIAQKLL